MAAELLTVAELCRKLKTSRRYVERLRKQGMPYLMLGKSPRFEYEAVLQWMRRQKEAWELLDDPEF